MSALVQRVRTGAAAVSMLNIGIAMVSFQGAAVVFIGLFLREHQIGWAEAFGLDSPRLGRTLSRALLAGFVVLPMPWLLSRLSVNLRTCVRIRPKEQQSLP